MHTTPAERRPPAASTAIVFAINSSKSIRGLARHTQGILALNRHTRKAAIPLPSVTNPQHQERVVAAESAIAA